MTATSTYEYRYDENWQLTKCTETLQNGITTEYDYQYDKDGNRSKYVKTVNGEWTECYTYEYNSANQLVSRTNQRLWVDNVTYYAYDADGNLISEQTGHFEKTYEYTAENRLAVVKAQGTVLMAALYDGDGNRLFTMDYTGENNDRWDIWIPECGGNADQVDDSAKEAMKELASLVSRKDRRDYTVTEYVNDITRENEEVLAELNHRGKVTTAYTYGYTRESADVYGDTQYFLYDGQGNVSRISSEWGRVKETYSYDPYGNLTYGVPDTVNYYGYNGESSNLATGLQYLRARYYSPQTGSFITEDTYAGRVSNPLTLNRYAYTSNNPVNYIDPSGHFGVLEQLGKQLGKVVNDVGTAIGKGLEKLGEGLNALGNAYMQGQQMAQQNQMYETQLITNFVTGNWDKPSNETSKIPSENDKIASDDVKGLAENNENDSNSENDGNKKNTLVDTVNQPADVKSQKQQAQKEAKKDFCDLLEEHETELKFVAGGLVIAGTGALAIISHGLGTKAFLGSIIGGIVGGFMSYVLAEEGEDKMAEAADGFMWGTITGAAGASLGQALSILGKQYAFQNTYLLAAIEGLLEAAIEEVIQLFQGEKLSFERIGMNLLLNIFTSGETPHMNKLGDALEPVMKKLGDWFDDTVGKIKSLIKGAEDSGPNSAGKEVVEEIVESSSGVLDNANYAQKTYSNTFSAEGRKIYSDLAGEPINTIDDLVNAINSGKVNVADLPVEYIVRDGNILILNTRTSQALTQAGIPRSQWNAIDRTGDPLFEELLTGQLSRNKLTSEGISMVRPSGGQ